MTQKLELLALGDPTQLGLQSFRTVLEMKRVSVSTSLPNSHCALTHRAAQQCSPQLVQGIWVAPLQPAGVGCGAGTINK